MRSGSTIRRSPPKPAPPPMWTANGAARPSSAATSGYSVTTSMRRRSRREGSDQISLVRAACPSDVRRRDELLTGVQMIEGWDAVRRLGAATLIGAAIGLNRDLHGKPIGVRTLGMVGLC